MWVLQTLQLHFHDQEYHLYFERNDDLTPAQTDVADQSQIDGCLVMSGHCLPSAADEEWYSSKRPSSTVVTTSVRQHLRRGKYLLLHQEYHATLQVLQI